MNKIISSKSTIITILGVVVLLVAGTWIRYTNLLHVGFRFDLITTQYEWGKAALNLGIISFWRDYTGYFDYLPGALYLDTVIYAISRIIGGTPEAFAIIMKSFNWITEIFFAFLVYWSARRFGNYSKPTALIYSTLAYILPSFWFVSSVWGQIDSIVVVLSIIALLIIAPLIDDDEVIYKRKSFYSGLLFGLAFWIKMQPILVLPIFVLILLSKRNKKVTLGFISGILLISGLILIIPLLTNVGRLGYVIGAPFLRESVISRSAVTFWTFIGATRQDFFNEEFHPEMVYRLVAITGLLIYACISLFAVFLTIKPKISTIFNNLYRPILALENLLYRKIEISEVLTIATISTVAYFEFMVKMYARYLHFGTMLAVVTLVTIRNKTLAVIWLVGAVLLNLGNFINLLGVYTWWKYEEPLWLTQWYQNISLNKESISAILTLTALVVFIWVARKTNHEPSV